MTNSNPQEPANTPTAPTAAQAASNKSFSSATINKLDGSKVEIVGTIPSETWEKYRKEAIKNINENESISSTFDVKKHYD